MRLAPNRKLWAVLLSGTVIGAPGAFAAADAVRTADAGATGVGTGSVSRRAPAACLGLAPHGLRLTRLRGPRARLTWSVPGRAARAKGRVFRVLRSGRTVGQTSGASLVMRIVPGRLTRYTVEVRHAGARTCSATLRTRLPVRPPGPVAGLRVISLTASGALIGWRAAAAGDAPVAGYRIERDGAVVGQTRALRDSLRLSRGRSHTVGVVGVDTRGHLGAAGATLLIGAQAQAAGAQPGTGAAAPKRESPGTTATQPPTQPTAHPAPTPPALLAAVRVTDTSATLSWQAGSASSGTVAGYVLYEDGQALGAVDGQIDTVDLASDREYTFTVATLDSAGYLSAPSPSLRVVTTHTPPPAPGGLTATQITSHSASLMWSPSKAVSGVIVGYRVFRDDIPVGQSAASEMTIADLAPSSEYKVTVSAVDSLGAVSEPSAPLVIHTAEPTPTHGDVQAYLLASTDQSFTDLQAHYEQIGVLYPTYFNCGKGGAVEGKDDPLVTDWALARKIAVLPRVNCQNVAEEEQILNEPAAREKTIEQLAALCTSHGYTGIQVDFEGAPPSQRNPFTAFITALAERLHAQRNKLSTVVTAKYYDVQTGRAAMYDDAALSGPSDYMFVLDWGLHWQTSTPGSIDEYAWFKRVAEYTATLPNRAKFVLGMPMYGIDWPNGGGPSNRGTALEFSEIAALASELSITPEWEPTAESPHFSYTDGEGVQHAVWYTDAQSIGARATLARSLGLGVGLWRLGSEDQSVWELSQLGGSG